MSISMVLQIQNLFIHFEHKFNISTVLPLFVLAIYFMY